MRSSPDFEERDADDDNERVAQDRTDTETSPGGETARAVVARGQQEQ